MPRRFTRPTLGRQPPDEAHALGLDVSCVAGERLGGAIGAERRRTENAEAIAAYNHIMEAQGLSLTAFRKS